MNKDKSKSIIFQISAILILIGAFGYYFLPDIFKFVVLAGVAGYGAIVLTSRYPGTSIRGKRLYNMQVFAALLMVGATYMMFRNFKEWILLMAIAAILILYFAFAIPAALKKESEEKGK